MTKITRLSIEYGFSKSFKQDRYARSKQRKQLKHKLVGKITISPPYKEGQHSLHISSYKKHAMPGIAKDVDVISFAAHGSDDLLERKFGVESGINEDIVFNLSCEDFILQLKRIITTIFPLTPSVKPELIINSCNSKKYALTLVKLIRDHNLPISAIYYHEPKKGSANTIYPKRDGYKTEDAWGDLVPSKLIKVRVFN